MRRILIRSAILFTLLAALFSLWIFEGRNFSLLIDRFGTAQLESRALNHIDYNGGESGGVLEIVGLPFSTQGADYAPFPFTLRHNSQDQAVLSTGGKSFVLGAASREGSELQIVPESGDKVSFNTRRGLLSWPTPLEINFMTGHSPSWKRNLYYHLRWQKNSGQKLEMVWRYEQYFYSSDGWASGFMTRQGTTGLIRVEVSR
jgi:hypothetical protein